MQPPANNPLFRPPAEADSLILQVDQGCPYNRCTFCGMYRRLPYHRLGLPEIRLMIAEEARLAPDTRRIFLADGDVMRRPFADLEAILLMLGEALPNLARVNLYATGSGIQSKTDAELARLRDLKLHTLYLGLESGDEPTLQAVRKGETAAGMVEAGRRARSSGLRLSVMILLGLGGQARSREHARETAAALNALQPLLLSALRVVPVPGTELHADATAGRFAPLTEHQVVDELRRIVQALELTHTVFRANHSSNIIPLEARLPRDQERLLAQLDLLLASGHLNAESPGEVPIWL
jgi:radical SAM superfamily enzyme YgiQ (UPF0313 family)